MKKISLLLSVLCLLLSSQAFAQQSMSLSEAIQAGLANNYDIQIEKKKISAAEINNSWGQAGLYPSLNFQLSNNNSLNIVNNPTSFIQGTIPSTGINPSVNLDWNILNGFKVFMNKRKLEKIQAESEGNADIVISNTIQTIVLSYYQAVLQKERLQVMKKNLTLSKDKYEYIKLKNEYGSAPLSELLLEEGNYLTDSINYINQEYQYKNAIRNLNLVLATDNPDQEYMLTETLEIPTADFQLDQLAGKMLENVDLKKMYISQQILRNNIGLAYAERLPSLNLRGGYSYSKSWNDLSSIQNQQGETVDYGIQSGVNQGANINLTLTFNLFNGGRINRAIKQAVIQEEIGMKQIEKVKTVIMKDLASSHDLYTVRKQMLAINQRKKEVADTNLDLNEEKFKNGSINSFDYRRIQINALQAEMEELQAKFNLINSNLDLMRLTGGIISQYQN
jgi:outer membrane protein